MSELRVKAKVGSDGTVTLQAPAGLALAECEVVLLVADSDEDDLRLAALDELLALPTLDLGPWPAGLSLRREDLYGEQGR